MAYFSQNGLLAPNGSRIETTASIYNRTQRLSAPYRALNDERARQLSTEQGATAPSYATPQIGIGGSRPPGLGFAFGDSWARTQRGVMEFQMPVGQTDNLNMAMRFAFENVFVAKALKLKTLFTTKGISNNTGDATADQYLDKAHRELYLRPIYRMAVWMYYALGLVPILLPEGNKPLKWLQLLDPRMVRVQRAYGKLSMYMVPDDRMRAAMSDKEGRSDPRNKDYYDAMPATWKKQLESLQTRASDGQKLIALDPDSYIVIENRMNPHDRGGNGFDGTPLQPYFAALDQYRMLAAGDFAHAFLMKNIVACVSVGDPKMEGDNYIRPDDQVLLGLQNTLQNPSQAMWMYADPTFNIRYFTPDPEALDNKKFNECKENLKQLLPSPFWASEKAGSFADATVELQQLEEEVVACQNDFDDQFWEPIHSRIVETAPKVAAKYGKKAPQHDRSALRSRSEELKHANNLYGNGGMSIQSLMEAHGVDPQVEKQRLLDQKDDVKKGVYMPAFEGKQGIVANKTYAINRMQGGAQKTSDKKPVGGQTKSGSKPNAESQTGRRPRPSEKGDDEESES